MWYNHSMLKNRYKKIIMFILCAVMTNVLFGCTFFENEASSEAATRTSEMTTEITTEITAEITTEASEDKAEKNTEEKTTESITTESTAAETKEEASDEIPPFSGKAYVEINNNIPDFTDEEKKCTDAFEHYTDLDELGRCGVAFVNVCKDIMPTEERGKIGEIKPSGWHTVKYPDLIEDNFLYNRSHLIAYSLAGENANEKNLISGTRYLNQETMQIFELEVLGYAHRTKNHVLYRVTPLFEGDNLLATGVQMEAWSVEDEGKGICFNVFCYNVQPGVEIDYATGESRRAEQIIEITVPETESSTEAGSRALDETDDFENTKMTFILNTGSHKVHLPDCKSVKDMSESNKLEYEGTLAEIKEQGYKPCAWCLEKYR